MYSKTVMDHFKKPRNVGVIEDADGVGEIGNPLCGDMMSIYLKIEDEKINDIKFQTFGCGAAIAVSSKVSAVVMFGSVSAPTGMDRSSVASQSAGNPSK